MENGYGSIDEKKLARQLAEQRKSEHERFSEQSDPKKSILYAKLSILATRIGYAGK